MKRARLRNKYLKNKSAGNKIAYKTKKKYFAYLNEINIAGNIQFWNLTILNQATMYFNWRVTELLTRMTEMQMFRIFSSLMRKKVKNPRIRESSSTVPKTETFLQPVLKVIFKHRKHPSADDINNITKGEKFTF